MTSEPTWIPIDLAEAFFPVAIRPLYMPVGTSDKASVRLKRHFAVVDVERQNPFAVVTADYELVTNEAAYEMAAEVMKKVFQTTNIGDMACLNITMPKTR